MSPPPTTSKASAATPTPAPRPTTRWRRWALRLGLIWLGWLLLANLLLLSGAAEKLSNRRPQRFSLAVDRAWSVLPFVVHVRGLELSGDTPRRYWRVTSARASCVFAVPTLVLRRVDLLWCHATELSVDSQPTKLALEPSQRPKWRTVLWRAKVEEVSRLSVDDLELHTPGSTASGGFDLVARGPFSSRSIRLHAPSSTLTSGATILATELKLEAETRVAPFVPSQHRSIDALKYFSGSLDASTENGSLAFLGRHLGRRPWLSFDGAQGAALDAELQIAAGALLPGSRLEARSDGVEVGLLRWTLRGGVALDISVDSEGRELVVAELDDITLRRPNQTDPIAHGPGARLELALDDAVLYRATANGSATFELPAAEVPDLRVFADLLPQRAGIDIVEGRAKLEASFALRSTARDSGEEELEAKAHFGLTAADVGIEARGRQVVADLELLLELEAQGEAVRRGHFDASSSSLVVSRGAAARGEALGEDRRFSARIDFDQASLELRGDPRFAASCRLSASDLRPFLGLALEGERSIDRVERWFELGEVEGTMHLTLKPGELELSQVELTSGPARLHAELCFRRDRHLLLHGAWNRLDIGRELLGADSSRWKLVGVEEWYREQAASWECLGEVPGTD